MPTRGQAPSVAYWPLYQHHPLRSLPQDGLQGGADLTHFTSMECTPNTAWDIFSEKVEALQEDAALVFPIGKKIKVTSMHLTIGTLLLKEEEVQKVHDQLQELTQKFLDVVGATYGLMLTFQGIGGGGPQENLG